MSHNPLLDLTAALVPARVTIEIEERFYRLRRAEERQDGTWWVHAHVLDGAPSNEIIRALIRYVPP